LKGGKFRIKKLNAKEKAKFPVLFFGHTTDHNTKIMNKDKERRKNDGNSGEEA